MVVKGDIILYTDDSGLSRGLMFLLAGKVILRMQRDGTNGSKSGEFSGRWGGVQLPY